jgi:hypothetical protein
MPGRSSPEYPRLVGADKDLRLELGDDARANAKKLRHDVADRLAAIRFVAHEIETTNNPTKDQRAEWAEMIQRNSREIVRMVVVVQDLPGDQPPPPDNPPIVAKVG